MCSRTSGILIKEKEEITLFNGREWRTHYWSFRKVCMYKLIERKTSVVEDIKQLLSMDSLTEDIRQH